MFVTDKTSVPYTADQYSIMLQHAKSIWSDCHEIFLQPLQSRTRMEKVPARLD